jgi:hypothetical protein
MSMSQAIPIASGDRVELLAGTRKGQRVTVIEVEEDDEGQALITYLDPCPVPGCDCDPYATILRSLVRPVVQ